MNPLEQLILRALSARGYKPVRRKELARTCGVQAKESKEFDEALTRLIETKQIVSGQRDEILLPSLPGKVSGTYRGNERGFGFVIPDTPFAEGDLFIPEGKSGGAITGDRVSAKVLKRGKRQGAMAHEGRVTEVIERGHPTIVGELRRQGSKWFVIPDGGTLHVPIHVGDPGAKNAKPADQVVVDITEYPVGNQAARGVILRVLGPRGEPRVETLGIIEQYDLPGEFPAEVLKEAKRVSASFDGDFDADGREDLRAKTIITIDPVDVRDFDDAISLDELPSGIVELGVHIADVAHFVVEGGAIDQEARLRSNSIYLPGTVIPMIPEVLSNGVCSLQEKQIRFTKSAFIQFDRRGQVKGARLANTVIESAKRLTYEHASAILDGQPGQTAEEVVALLQRMERLAKVIRKRRLRKGMLELDLPESELIYDDNGKVIGAEPADTSFSHKIIEMFMVEANEAVARALVEKGVPALRRIHDEPRDLLSGELGKFLSALGQELPDDPDRFDLQKLLKASSKSTAAFAVHYAILRSMRPAEYAPIRKGHYALASEHYCHFTSPIRRYPDLTIHRLVDALVQGRLDHPEGIEKCPSDQDLMLLGRLCGENERRAEAAGRELTKVFLLRLLEEKYMGEEFVGVVTGLANSGIFLQLDKFLIDGLLRFDQLPEDDWWEIAQNRAMVVGEHTGRCITVGDRIKVKIARVQIPLRQLDLALAQKLTGSRKKTRSVASRKTKASKAKPKGSRTKKAPKRRTKKPGPKNRKRR